jgi:hypothetical protein
MPPVIVANTGMVATVVMVAIVMVPASGPLARLPPGIHRRRLHKSLFRQASEQLFHKRGDRRILRLGHLMFLTS